MHQAPDLFALWHAWEDESGARSDVPYWGVVWPAAEVLTGFLLAEPARVTQRTVLDLGCGGGVAAIAAARAGASRVIANDRDSVALAIAARNACANGVELELTDANLLGDDSAAQVDLILVADLFYERGVADIMQPWLIRAARRGVTVLLVDAGRPFAPREGVRVLAEQLVSTNPDLEGRTERIVRVMKLI